MPDYGRAPGMPLLLWHTSFLDNDVERRVVSPLSGTCEIVGMVVGERGSIVRSYLP